MLMLSIIGFLLEMIAIIFLVCMIAILICKIGEVVEFAIGKKDGFFTRAREAIKDL